MDAATGYRISVLITPCSDQMLCHLGDGVALFKHTGKDDCVRRGPLWIRKVEVVLFRRERHNGALAMSDSDVCEWRSLGLLMLKNRGRRWCFGADVATERMVALGKSRLSDRCPQLGRFQS